MYSPLILTDIMPDSTDGATHTAMCFVQMIYFRRRNMYRFKFGSIFSTRKTMLYFNSNVSNYLILTFDNDQMPVKVPQTMQDIQSTGSTLGHSVTDHLESVGELYDNLQKSNQ